ncbi:submandibular gland secretory Glx-rich protein CA-like [Mus caroli]|uniref:Submandibular gland secretory Glx-rich protein CA-like n=1 Tax=Mus caroli TaxID=10089 RepID=A0A6P5PAR7_MUSCR|nr:submandibular gland secretory Glx-rich protein CA-like [Mus caroli]
MLVVLLTAALLALSSAQSADEDVQSTSNVQEQAPVDQTQDSSSDPSSDDANTGNVQVPESASAGNESSANSGSGQEQQQQAQESQQADGQGPSDSAVKEQESQTGEERGKEVQGQHNSHPENPGVPQHVKRNHNNPSSHKGGKHIPLNKKQNQFLWQRKQTNKYA